MRRVRSVAARRARASGSPVRSLVTFGFDCAAEGRPGLACGLCLALGGLSVLEKTTQEMATRGPLAAAASPAVSPFSPTYKRREIWFEELKERLGRE